MEAQSFDDLGVAEVQHRLPLLHHGHLRAERGEDRCVFDADDARSDHDHRRWNLLQAKDAVGVQHALVVEFDALRARGFGPGRNDDVITRDRGAFGVPVVVHDDGVRVQEASVAGEQIDLVAHELRAHHVDFLGDHVCGTEVQILGRDLVLDAVTGAVELALAHTRQIDDRLTQRLGRNACRC